ncbi:unnamed protein product [Symbiodinium pilosum]|uniref:Uncharacterized protein n=1 Tax=Symbiodinium pilosum TaxID=2952 RepID=A0A812U707_SYMPI|nr:unnamed protein product [Symbiodinium pilosum]
MRMCVQLLRLRCAPCAGLQGGSSSRLSATRTTPFLPVGRYKPTRPCIWQQLLTPALCWLPDSRSRKLPKRRPQAPGLILAVQALQIPKWWAAWDVKSNASTSSPTRRCQFFDTTAAGRLYCGLSWQIWLYLLSAEAKALGESLLKSWRKLCGNGAMMSWSCS